MPWIIYVTFSTLSVPSTPISEQPFNSVPRRVGVATATCLMQTRTTMTNDFKASLQTIAVCGTAGKTFGQPLAGRLTAAHYIQQGGDTGELG